MRAFVSGLLLAALLAAALWYAIGYREGSNVPPPPVTPAWFQNANADDPNRHLDPGPMEDAAYLQEKLDLIFPQGMPDTPEEKVLHILSYVAQATRMQYSDTASGTIVLQQGHGFCYGMALAFVALCKQAGLPARVNALHNIEWMEAHNTAEVHYDGAWHCFDPTYATFFYGTRNYGGGAVVPSLREIMAAPDRYHCIQLTQQLWSGAWSPDINPSPLDPTKKFGNWSFTLAEFYSHVFRNAFPVVYDTQQRVTYPIQLDLRDATRYEIGKPDGDIMDTYGKAGGRYPRFHGIPYLGQVRLGNAMHLLAVRIKEPARLVITYHLAKGSSVEGIEAIEMRSAVIERTESSAKQWKLHCYVQRDGAELLLAHQEGAAFIDAITAEVVSPDNPSPADQSNWPRPVQSASERDAVPVAVP